MSDQQAGALDRVTESVYAKFLLRVVMPLVGVLLVPLIGAQWNAMRADIGDVKQAQTAQAEKVILLERQVTTIDTKLDAGLIWRLAQLERRFEAMEARVERREASRTGM